MNLLQVSFSDARDLPRIRELMDETVKEIDLITPNKQANGMYTLIYRGNPAWNHFSKPARFHGKVFGIQTRGGGGILENLGECV